MAIQLKHQVLSDANSLQQRLLEAQNIIQHLEPPEQLQKAAALTGEAVLLTQLQNRVSASFLRGQEAIPDASEEDLLAISEKLSAASDILEAIQANSDIAADLLELADEVRSVFEGANPGNITQRQAQLPNGRLIDMASNPKINTGNRDAVERLQAMILSCQQPVPSAIQAPEPNRVLIAEQDETFQVTQLHDRWGTLCSSLKRVPKEDFDVLLPFYVELKTFGSNKTQFIAQKNKVVFENLLQGAEGLLLTMIESQKIADNIQAPAPQGLRVGDNRAVNTRALQELKWVFDSACSELGKANADRSAIDKKVQEVFSKTSPDEREQVLAAVNMINQEEKKRTVPQTLLNQPCKMWTDYPTLQKALQRVISSAAPAQAVGSPALNKLKKVLETAQNDLVSFTQALKAVSDELSESEKKELHKVLSEVLIAENKMGKPLTDALLKMPFNAWPGAPILKLKAVDKLLESLAPKAPARVVASSVVKASDEMAKRLAKAQAQFAAKQPVAPAVKSIRAEPSKVPGEMQLPRARETREETITLSSIKTLQGVLNLLGPNASHHDFQFALEKLVILESVGNKVPFKISGNAPALIADRPCFHLYFIHKNESPDKLVNDMQYGNKAMAGVYPTSNGERTRAIQRTVVELALEGLEDAVNFNSLEDMRESLAILHEVGLKLNTKDMPPGEFRNSNQAQTMAQAWTSLFNINAVLDAKTKSETILSIGLIRNLLKQAWML